MPTKDIPLSESSDSEEEDDRKRELKRRMREFQERKQKLANEKAKKHIAEGTEAQGEEDGMSFEDSGKENAASLCCQIVMEEDYMDYTGIPDGLERRGWVLIGPDRKLLRRKSHELSDACANQRDAHGGGSTRSEKDAVLLVPDLQWSPYARTAWAAVLKGQVVSNHYFMRSSLIRKSDLAKTLLPSVASCMPETHVAHITNEETRTTFCAELTKLAMKRGGVWVLKAGDSSNATDMRVFDASCLDAAVELIQGTSRTSWLVQRYIERPMLLHQRKFHLRATVLAVGRLAVYLHSDVVALLASVPFELADLGNMLKHASNHSVQDRAGQDGEAILLPLIPAAVSAEQLPAIVDVFGDDGQEAGGEGREKWRALPTDADVAAVRGAMALEGAEGAAGEWASQVWVQLARLVQSAFVSATAYLDQSSEHSLNSDSARSSDLEEKSNGPATDSQGAEDEAMKRADGEEREGGGEGSQGRPGFLPIPCCFELFGLDAMVDAEGRVWLLELNCDPDITVFGPSHRTAAQRTVSDCLDTALPAIFGGQLCRPPADAQELQAGARARVNGFKLVFKLEA